MVKQREVGSKVNRELLQIARDNGARIVWGKKHILVFDGSVMVCGLSYGSGARNHKAMILKRYAKRGWKW